MKQERIDELREIAEKAEFGLSLHLTTVQMVGTSCYTEDGHGVFKVTDMAICESIVTAINSYLDLLAHIESQDKEIAKLEKRLMEHGEALNVLNQLRLLYNLSPDMREPMVESAAKLLMKQSQEGLRVARDRRLRERITALQAEIARKDGALGKKFDSDILFKWLKKAYELGVKRDRFSDQQSDMDMPILDYDYVPKMAEELTQALEPPCTVCGEKENENDN